MRQLKTYRKFGSPAVSLLDIYLCETGFLNQNDFPPPVLRDSLLNKMHMLHDRNFGYQLLPVEYSRTADGRDHKLSLIRSSWDPLKSPFDLLQPGTSSPTQPFARLADHLDEFFEKSPNRTRKSFHQIVYCRSCRELRLISMKEEHKCPSCNSDLVRQS